MRSTWDETWINVALVVSRRSPCINRQVGAVLVDHENRIISVGYNGFPRRMVAPNSCDAFCPRSSGDRGREYTNCIAIHAEVNAIINASVHGRGYDTCTLYVTSMPCIDCAKVIANAQIKRVIVLENPQDDHYNPAPSLLILNNSAVEVATFSPAGGPPKT